MIELIETPLAQAPERGFPALMLQFGTEDGQVGNLLAGDHLRGAGKHLVRPALIAIGLHVDKIFRVTAGCLFFP